MTVLREGGPPLPPGQAWALPPSLGAMGGMLHPVAAWGQPPQWGGIGGGMISPTEGASGVGVNRAPPGFPCEST